MAWLIFDVGQKMSGSIQDSWTYAVTFIRMKFGDTELSTGSGFFWLHNGRYHLITNWHNLSGREPITKKPKSPTGGIPDRITLSVFKRVSEERADGSVDLQSAELSLPLYSEFPEKGIWWEHPTRRDEIDVAALILPDIFKKEALQAVGANELEGDADVAPFASQDVFIVGYPLGLVAGVPIPVWKRGTIATEPSIDPDGLPLIYVDSATRPGMSGSVVIARHILAGPYQKKDGSKSNTLYAVRNSVLGVYSGRLHPSHVEAQLGRVWKRSVIDETIKGVRFYKSE